MQLLHRINSGCLEQSSFVCFVFCCPIDDAQEANLAWLSHLKVCLQGGGGLQREQQVSPVYYAGVGGLYCSIPGIDLSDLTLLCMAVLPCK